MSVALELHGIFWVNSYHLNKKGNNTHNTFTRKLFKTYTVHIEPDNILFDFKRLEYLFGSTDIYE